jgi:hypothetical protein
MIPHARMQRRGLSLPTILVLVLIIGIALTWFINSNMGGRRHRAGAAVEAPAGPDLHVLEGRWMRPDSGTSIEIGRIEREGTISVTGSGQGGMFVSGATVQVMDGLQEVNISFSDSACSGCSLELTYDASGDRLVGKQRSADGTGSNVLFTRIRE